MDYLFYFLATLQGSCGYKHMKLARRKHPDCPADSCKRLSINQMAVG